MKNPPNKTFNSQHSPVGAFASFTLGYPGASGGFGLEMGKPADQDIYIGVQEAGESDSFKALPFFNESVNAQEEFVLHDQGDVDHLAKLNAIDWEHINRDLEMCSDSWVADDLEFHLYSPAWKLPEPGVDSDDCLKQCVIPAVFAELVIDNRNHDFARRAFFGFQPDNVQEHIRENWNLKEAGITSLCCGRKYGVATNYANANTGIHFTPEHILGEPDRDRFHFGNGTIGLIDFIVPAHEKVTIPLVIGFFHEGIVTSGLESRYYYTRFFDSLNAVFASGLEHFEVYKNAANDMNLRLSESALSDVQKFHVAQSVHSYFGSTQLLDYEGNALWIINEGEYRMMNTLDLTADQLFYELEQNPWTVRNVLDFYLENYSYEDETYMFGDPESCYPGGISFAHDMGVHNCFTKPGTSCYELSGLKGCFSYMTHEELVNWICCAGSYCHSTNDKEWQRKNLETLKSCFQSLCNRDHYDPDQRNGIMSLDSRKTNGGAEITTYDSLDVSLGQARDNAYLAVKTWICYLALSKIFTEEGEVTLAEEAMLQAKRGADSILGNVNGDGLIPAVFNTDFPSVIIPIVEGLVFVEFAGCTELVASESKFSELISALKHHCEKVIKNGNCLFDSGAWKLSSSSINSWLSKTYLCQYVVRSILKLNDQKSSDKADVAHMDWLLEKENSYWAWGDQFYEGVLKGSKYYPRGVTSILWLRE